MCRFCVLQVWTNTVYTCRYSCMYILKGTGIRLWSGAFCLSTTDACGSCMPLLVPLVVCFNNMFSAHTCSLSSILLPSSLSASVTGYLLVLVVLILCGWCLPNIFSSLRPHTPTNGWLGSLTFWKYIYICYATA